MVDLSSAEPGDTVIVALKVMRKEINSAGQTKVVVAVPGGGFWTFDEKMEVRAIGRREEENRRQATGYEANYR